MGQSFATTIFHFYLTWDCLLMAAKWSGALQSRSWLPIKNTFVNNVIKNVINNIKHLFDFSLLYVFKWSQMVLAAEQEHLCQTFFNFGRIIWTIEKLTNIAIFIPMKHQHLSEGDIPPSPDFLKHCWLSKSSKAIIVSFTTFGSNVERILVLLILQQKFLK